VERAARIGTDRSEVNVEVMPTDRELLIVPSVLAADFSRLGDEVVALQKAGVDRIQWDVMDGRFVPNITFGPDVIASVRDRVTVPFEAHLMIEDPAWVLADFVRAGCDRLIVHVESCVHLHRVLHAVRDAGARAAVALNPSTPAAAVDHVLDIVDMVLVMTVNPGFGGQRYIATMERKIAEIRRSIVERGLPVDIEVDGGIAVNTVAGAVRAGANVLVAGSALYRDEAGLEHAVAELREAAGSAGAAA
jgi:ribulose-phosphate 3-epimerase